MHHQFTNKNINFKNRAQRWNMVKLNMERNSLQSTL